MITLIGMSVVFIFLTLLVLAVQFTSKLLEPQTAAELAQMRASEAAKARRSDPGRKTKLLAVISAAVTMHRAKRRDGAS